jgi:hypothetical protein
MYYIFHPKNLSVCFTTIWNIRHHQKEIFLSDNFLLLNDLFDENLSFISMKTITELLS